MPGGIWGQQARNQSSGFGGFSAPRPASPFDDANVLLRGGGSASYGGRGDSSIQKRQFADVGKANINLLDPLAQSRAAVNYQPVEGTDGGLLGLGNYYNPMQPGGLFAGLFGGIAQTVGGIFGEGGAKTGSDVGTFLGKTLEMPLAAVGSAGVPFIAPIIDAANSEIEKYTPYILRDTLKIPTNVGGAFQSMLNIFGLAGMAVERTYAGMDARGALPPDIEERIDKGEITRDEGFDELVLSSRGYSNDVLHNLGWNLLLDPANWASLGVGAVGGAVKGTATIARAFGSTVRADAALAGRLTAQGGRIAEVTQAALRREAITGMVDSRGLMNQMRTAIDNTQSPFHLSYVERLGMSALGPVSPEVGNVVARVGNHILRATDPVNFFSGSKAGQRSMQALTTSASTGVIAAYKPQVVLALAKMADRIGGEGSDRVYRSIGINGSNALQEHGLSNLATDAMQAGGIPRTGTLDPPEAVRELLRGGAYDSNLGKYIEVQVERNKDISVGMLPPKQMYDETVQKFASLLNVDVSAVTAVMKTVSSDDAILVHALYYYAKGEALHTGVLAALKASKAAKTLASFIDPDRVAIISSKTLTKGRVGEIEAALASGDVAAIRQATDKYNDFNWVHNKNVPDADLKEVVTSWMDVNKPYLLEETVLKDATGAWLPGVPEELKAWANDSETFGYMLGQKMPGNVPEDALWRITRAPGKDGEILNANPYSDFWVEGGDSAQRLNRFTATKMAMTRGIRQERIVWSQRRRFITDFAKGSEDGGIDIPPALGDRIFKALMYEAKDRFIQPRGMEPREMYQTAKRVLDDARKTNSSYDNLATKLTERQVVLTLLRATQGEVGLVGVTQKVTGGIKAYAPGSGANYWGRISERLYPLMRFTLNPIFQTMEATEPYILNSMRGIWTPLNRNGDVYQQALATRNALSQLIRNSDDPDGIAAETAEALASQAYQGSQATAHFGRGKISRWMPHIGERKDVAMAMETERIMGDHMYRAFEQILGDRFEAHWADLEAMFGTQNRGQIAMRWMTANFALQDVNGFRVGLVDDIMKMKTLGKKMRLTKNGDNGAYTFADVEQVFDHARSYDSSWNQGLRRERDLKPGEALEADLKGMTREEWHEEVRRTGLNTDNITRVSERMADDIYNMANGPTIDEFWNGEFTVSGTRYGGYRQTYLQGVTGEAGGGTSAAVWTRMARDQEVESARAFVRAWARAAGQTEEEYIKLHFEDIPRVIDQMSTDLNAQSLTEIRAQWAEEVLEAGPVVGRAADGRVVQDAFYRDVPGHAGEVALAGLEQTMNDGQHLVVRLDNWFLDNLVDEMSHGVKGKVWGTPNVAYDDVVSLFDDTTSGDVYVRMSKDHAQGAKRMPDGTWHFPGMDYNDARNLEILTTDGWESLAVKSRDIKPGDIPRAGATHSELVTGRYLYGNDPAAPAEVTTAITEIDLHKVLMTDKETSWVGEYTRAGYRALNRWLRGRSQDPNGYGANIPRAQHIEMRDAIDASIQKGQTPDDIILFRGINLNDLDGDIDIPYSTMKLGDTFSDPAFLSTSTTKKKAREFADGEDSWGGNPDHEGVVLTLQIPAGFNMNIIKDMSSMKEDEHLLGRDIGWRVVGKRVEKSADRGATYHLTIEPITHETKPGVKRMGWGELDGGTRTEGRMAQDAMSNPEGLRRELDSVDPEARYDIEADVELAIEKAEAAKPAQGRVTIGGQTFGQPTSEEFFAEIEEHLDGDEIDMAGSTLADVRKRISMLMESEQWDPYHWKIEKGPTREIDRNSSKFLTALAVAIVRESPSGAGFRYGLQRVISVMEDLWTLGPESMTAKNVDPVTRQIASDIMRGVGKGMETPVLTNIMNDAADAMLGNTSRRITGRVDAMQPILADDTVAEAAGFLTHSAADQLTAQGYRIDGAIEGVAPAAAVPPTAAAPAAPIPTGTLPVTGKYLSGSTGPIQVKDPATGKLYVDKRGANPGHIREESIADSVYEAVGAPVAPHTVIEGADTVKRAEMIEGGQTIEEFWETASPAERDAVRVQLQQHFAVDALLANWDVVGLVGDNIIIKDGVPYRIDNGGALRYRAQGGLKDDYFGPEVSELQRMRGGGNKWQARIFGDLSDADLARQVLDLGPKMDAILAQIPEELHPLMRERYADMVRQMEGITPTPSAVEAAATPLSPRAGVKPQKIGTYEHEYLVDFYNQRAREANERGFNGRSDWTAADIAQVAGRARQKMGRTGGRAVSVNELIRQTGEVHGSVAPGPGSMLHQYAGIFEILSQKRYRAERQDVMRVGSLIIHRGLRDKLGLIIETSDELGMGLFDGDAPSPTMSVHLLNSPEKTQMAARVIAFITGQPAVRAWSNGPSVRDITDFGAYTARATIHIPASDTTPRLAEKMAEAIGRRWPGAVNAYAERNADGSWYLRIVDDDGKLFPRLDSGEVDEDGLYAMLGDISQAEDIVKLGIPPPSDLITTYGHHYETPTPRMGKDGTYDWDAFLEDIVVASEKEGRPIRASDVSDIRSTYNNHVRDRLSQVAPDQYARASNDLPLHGRDLEDRRGGQLLGLTSPRSSISAVIRGFAAADPLTGLHELIHVFSIGGAENSMREVVSKAFGEYRVANDAAVQARIGILQQKAAAATHKSTKSRFLNEITALQHQLQSPHPGEWSQEHEEFFVHLVYDWIRQGVPDNPELANAFNHFRNWLDITKRELDKPGLTPIQISPAMESMLNRMFSRRGVETVPYSVEQQTLRMAMKQVTGSAFDEAHATHFYKRDRSMAERSINHPYIGLYPASYMWGKILPEMVRFLALRPFGMETPFLAWNVAREVSDSVRAQAELDPGFKDWMANNEDAFMLFSMLFPGLPHEIPANASLPVRRIAEQGLESQRQYAQGIDPAAVKDIDFAKGSQDAIQYALGPLGAIRTFSEATSMGGNLVRSALGEVVPKDTEENLPYR